MPPLWQLLVPDVTGKPDESISAPKGRGSRTPATFPCKTPISGGRWRGP
jgi:hypothetical protein